MIITRGKKQCRSIWKLRNSKKLRKTPSLQYLRSPEQWLPKNTYRVSMDRLLRLKSDLLTTKRGLKGRNKFWKRDTKSNALLSLVSMILQRTRLVT
jgi:hypothetical protein